MPSCDISSIEKTSSLLPAVQTPRTVASQRRANRIEYPVDFLLSLGSSGKNLRTSMATRWQGCARRKACWVRVRSLVLPTARNTRFSNCAGLDAHGGKLCRKRAGIKGNKRIGRAGKGLGNGCDVFISHGTQTGAWQPRARLLRTAAGPSRTLSSGINPQVICSALQQFYTEVLLTAGILAMGERSSGIPCTIW